MLRSLNIRDFVIVSHAHIEFEAGFTVFSGETGAGKSILIDALSLVLGARGDTKVIREHCDKADISAQFDCSEAVTNWLIAHELEADGDLLLRRIIDSQGRSRAFINGSPATLTQLRDVGEFLVDIHGQHAHQSLLKAAKQYELLDSQGGHSDVAKGVQQAWTVWQELRRQYQQAAEQADQLAARANNCNGNWMNCRPCNCKKTNGKPLVTSINACLTRKPSLRALLKPYNYWMLKKARHKKT